MKGAVLVAGAACLLLLSSSVAAIPSAAAAVSPGAVSPSAYGFDVPFNVSVPSAINPVNPTAIPIGDGHVSMSSPKAGFVYSCRAGGAGGGGSASALPWVNTTTDAWNSSLKVHVAGNVSWPGAGFAVSTSGDQRVISGDDLPIDHNSGVFPIRPSDPAYEYDHNPNSIQGSGFSATLPLTPVVASVPSCLPLGPIGVLSDGIFLFNALDALDRDAMVHEVLDAQCDGHPDSGDLYHHHDIPSCILAKATGNDTSTLVGYALDGFGIYVERDANGTMLTNANLDECHGRTSEVMWNGKPTVMYHYVATAEYPYTVGCFRGTPASVAFTSTTPSPGTPTTIWYVAAGAVLLAGAVVAIVFRRKRGRVPRILPPPSTQEESKKKRAE